MEKFQKSLSVAKELFLGSIVEENLFPYPKLEGPEKETLEMVLDSVKKFMEENAEEFRKFDVQGFQADDYINMLKELGLFGLIIPEEHGGLGFSNRAYSRVIQETSRYDASTSLTIGAHSSIGMRGLLLYGTDAQKAKYYPKLASGEYVAAFCLTESGAGSDAASVKTNAVKQADGTWLLNGEKIWITNGPFAEFFTVFAKTDSAHGKMSAFLVERAFAGVSSGPKEDKMGIRGSATSTVIFQDVRVPAENLLGEEGQGFKLAMGILNSGRTGLGGGCVGAMKAMINAAIMQATNRKQFGRSITEFGLVREKIAQMTIDCFAAESAVNMVAYYSDQKNDDYSVEAAISKIFATEALWKVVFEALQIAGGNGFMREYPYERVTRDSRINLIFEGTNEILRLYVALSGMKEAGNYLKDIGKSAAKIFNDPIKGFGVLSEYAQKKISQLTTIGREGIAGLPAPLQESGKVYETYTSVFAQSVEGLLKKFGKDIIGQQYHSKRIADVNIDLFVGLSMLSRVRAMVEEKGAEKCKDEINILHLFSQQAKRRMNQNLRRIEKNDDAELDALASAMVTRGGYFWDVL